MRLCYAAVRGDGLGEGPELFENDESAPCYVTDCATGIQLHGGIGMTWEHDLHLYLKRAKADEVALGDATWHRERIARLMAA